jgi:uridine kinase
MRLSDKDQVIRLVRSILDQQDQVILGIDGRCGSGKTTFAKDLLAHFDGVVIHMDDFFLPKDMRTLARMEEPGGNVHYERVLEEVISPILKNAPISYRKFRCDLACFETKPIELPTARLIIIEGAYAFHPLLQPYYDLKVFMTHSPEKQKQRIVKRNGELGWSRFETMWIPLEEKHIGENKVLEFCDVILDTSGENW